MKRRKASPKASSDSPKTSGFQKNPEWEK